MSVSVPTDDKILFVEEFVIPSFDTEICNDQTSKARKQWMKRRQASKGWPVDQLFEELIIIYGSLTREEATERLKQLHQQLTQDNNLLVKEKNLVVKENNLLVKELNKVKLFDSAVFENCDMRSFLEKIKACNFEAVPEEFLSEYKKTTNSHFSTPQFFANISNSTLVPHEKNCLDLSNFNFGYLKERENTYQIFIEDNLSRLKQMLCQYLFKGNHESFNRFVEHEIENLVSVRQLLYAKYIPNKKGIEEVNYIQRLTTMMEADFLSRIQNDNDFQLKHQKVQVEAAQNFRLHANVTVSTTSHEHKIVRLKGFSDIIVTDMSHKVLRVQELKAACKQGCLFQCSAWAGKSQLCGQLYCLGDMSKHDIIIGGLLDLFAISVVIRTRLTEHPFANYFVSERVVQPEAFILVMMLNLFGLPKDDIVALTASVDQLVEPLFPPVEYEETDEMEDINLNEIFEQLNVVDSHSKSDVPITKQGLKKEEKKIKHEEMGKELKRAFRDEDNDDDDKDIGTMKRGPVQTRVLRSATLTAHQTSDKEKKQQKKSSGSGYNRSGYINYTMLENRREEVQDLLEWDHRRRGLAYLTASELNKRNATNR